MTRDDFTHAFIPMAQWLQKDAEQRDIKPKAKRVPIVQPMAVASVPGALLRVALLALEELEWLGQLSAGPLRADLRRVIAAATSASDTPTESQGA